MTYAVTSAQFIAPIVADDGMVGTRATERQSSCDSPAERYWSEPQACENVLFERIIAPLTE
jgi:hypothetical protein